MSVSPQQADEIFDEWVDDPALRIHMRSVEVVMRALADRYGEDPDLWGATGLLHDADYQKWPQEHPRLIVDRLQELGAGEMAQAIACHYTKWGAPCETPLDKALLAADELTGFILAVARVRPNKLQDLTPKSVKKKLKDKSFAAGVERDEVAAGVEALGVDLTEHIEFIIAALRPHQERFLPST